MRNGNLFADKIRPLVFASILSLALPGALLSGAMLDLPVLEDSRKEDAASFNTTAKTVLAPVYPYLAEQIAERFGLADKHGTGIDIGGGPGDLVLELSSRAPGFYWVDADLNPFFAGYLFRGALDRDCSGRVGFIPADVHALPFHDNYADIVISRGSMQQWNDPELAFAEILRVLKPGGFAYIGRGFPEDMPLGIAEQVRKKQGGGPKYDPGKTAHRLEGIMESLGIPDYEILRPRTDQELVNYGVWLVFSKPEG